MSLYIYRPNSIISTHNNSIDHIIKIKIQYNFYHSMIKATMTIYEYSTITIIQYSTETSDV